MSDDAVPATHAVDGALGQWSHTEWRPPHLRPWVDRLWLFEGVVALRRERTFPDGNLDLILQLEGRYRPGDDAGAAAFPIASVNGVLLEPHVVESPDRRVRILGIRIRAAGAYAILGGTVPELTGVTVDLSAVIGSAADELAARCAELTTEDALHGVARFIEHRLAQSPADDRAVAWAADRIEATAGRASIARLAERAGLAGSTLTRRFRARTGVTPKRFARIQRFRRALDRLHAEPSIPLSSLAYDAGYYDQPHMNADFREMAGMTPTQYLASVRYPGSASLAEAV